MGQIAWISSVLTVAAFAVLIGLPHRELDWEGWVLPMARNYAGVSARNNDQQPLRGKVVVITGCTNGIGLSLTKAMSKLGATVVGIGRSSERLRRIQQDIPTLEPVVADLSNLTSVARAAKEIQQRWDAIDILINNAGIHDSMSNLWGDKVSAQGYDLVFAVNYLSHFLLTEMLSTTLHNHTTTYPILVQVTSTFHWAVDGSDLIVPRRRISQDASMDNQPHFRPPAAQPGGSVGGFHLMRSTRSYSNSKLAQLYHARSLKRKHPLWSSSPGARIVSFCPSFVATNIAGQAGSLGYFFVQGGFPSDGWGLASAFMAIFDATDLSHDYYSNSKVYDSFLELVYRHPPRWMDALGIRDALMMNLAFMLQPFQKLGARAAAVRSSTESYNEEIADALYDWSLKAIQRYL